MRMGEEDTLHTASRDGGVQNSSSLQETVCRAASSPVTASALQQVNRAALQVVYAIAVTGAECADYEQIQRALGLRSYTGVKNSVRTAEAAGLVTRVETGGRYGRTLVYLTDEAKELLADLKSRREKNVRAS